jgi:hypothetical protein
MIAKVILGQWQQMFSKHLIYFDTLLNKNQMSFIVESDTSPNYDRLGFLRSLNGSFFWGWCFTDKILSFYGLNA